MFTLTLYSQAEPYPVLSKYASPREMFSIHMYCKLFHFLKDSIGTVPKHNNDSGFFSFLGGVEI